MVAKMDLSNGKFTEELLGADADDKKAPLIVVDSFEEIDKGKYIFKTDFGSDDKFRVMEVTIE